MKIYIFKGISLTKDWIFTFHLYVHSFSPTTHALYMYDRTRVSFPSTTSNSPTHQLTTKITHLQKKVELNSALYKTVAASLYRYAVYVKTQIYFKFEIEFIYLKWHSDSNNIPYVMIIRTEVRRNIHNFIHKRFHAF